ncbi:MAG: 50S ribosomal protein L23 [Clostridia bacterium]|nr:50S ribosomal protein L23 [Clostridia bacterium]MBR2303250.1 50S ribosomal protein L23 [Clostridia bacterium]MBR2371610.1 50S ribosomal protein L23 [Clostridia bacterium]
MKHYDIIRKPVLSEKSYSEIANKKYVFEVAVNANKIEIKEAIEAVFGVKVEKVNTINVRGKLKRQGRTQGYTAKRKKAIVQLTKDSKAIEIFENLA